MQIGKAKVEELMLKAFKQGQVTYKCEDYPMRLWIADELYEAGY